MAAACSACDGPLPAEGAYSVSVSLDAAATRRWRTCAMACSVPCLAAVAARMGQDAERRAARQAGDVAALMTQRPRGRR